MKKITVLGYSEDKVINQDLKVIHVGSIITIIQSQSGKYIENGVIHYYR